MATRPAETLGDDSFDDSVDDWDLDTRRSSETGLGWLLAIGGLVGLASAFILTLDKFKIAENPNFQPSCNISPFISCGNVMQSPEGEVFGFANPLMGLIGFSIVVTMGVLLVAKTEFPGWVWGGLQVGVILGIGLIHWLIFQSLYDIGSLCPYCMVVWAVMVPIFFFVTRRNLAAYGAHSGNNAAAGAATFLSNWAVLVMFFWYLAIVLLIAQRFWGYWSDLIFG